jgi:hypothetical protein
MTASNKTGRQTIKRVKAGARVTSKTAFVGEGMVLAEEQGKGKGAGFRKQAARQGQFFVKELMSKDFYAK